MPLPPGADLSWMSGQVRVSRDGSSDPAGRPLGQPDLLTLRQELPSEDQAAAEASRWKPLLPDSENFSVLLVFTETPRWNLEEEERLI